MKHTPGPWEADANDQDERCIVGSDHTVVCYMSGIGPQTDADERLIAAAPELLEALQDLLTFAKPHFSDETQQIVADKARAAIGKAVG